MKYILYALTFVAFITLISDCGGRDKSSSSVTAQEHKMVLNTKIQSDQIELYWQSVSDAIAYNLEWGESPNALSHVEHFDANTTMFTHKNIAQDTIYYYRLVVLFQEKQSQYSKVLAVKSGSKTQLMQSDAGI